MQRLSLASLDIPECYLVDNQTDINICQQYGLPYVIWNKSLEELQKAAMLSTMKQQFPGINWEKEYGINEDDIPEINMPQPSQGQEEQGQGQPSNQSDNSSEENNTNNDGQEEQSNEHLTNAEKGNTGSKDTSTPMGIASTEYRSFHDANKKERSDEPNSMKLNEFINDANVSVDVNTLLKLKLLPKFLSKIVQAIQVDKTKSQWQMGYDKKRKLCIGNLKPKKVLRNLIILDVSGSIPRGIADTMITLLKTLKDQLHADVIVTADPSKGWTYEEELPSPEWIRKHFSCGNESYDFITLLQTKFNNVKFNNVYSFGDTDMPWESKYIHKNNSVYKDKPNEYIPLSYYTKWDDDGERRFALPIRSFKEDGKCIVPKISVRNVYHFHTMNCWSKKELAICPPRTGYAMWCKALNPHVKEHYDNKEWCTNMYSDGEY